MELVSPHRLGARPWAVCAVLLLATMLNYMDRQALAVTLPKLKQEFHLAEARAGMVEGCFGYAFAFGSLLFGVLADRWGPRWLYPIVLVGWSCAGIATACAGQPWLTQWIEWPGDAPGAGTYRWLLLCRILLGVCEAGHWPCALLTVRAILPLEQRALGNGILQSGASLGAILVPLYVEAAERAGQAWQFPFWSIGVIGLIWVPCWFAAVRGLSLTQPHSRPIAPTSLSEPDQANLVQRIVVLLVIVVTLNISWQFLRAWLGLFLQDYHHYSKLATRGIMSGYFIVTDIGCILSGVLVTQMARQGWRVAEARRVGYLLFSLLAACGALVPYVGDGWLLVMMLFIAGAGILGLHPYYYALTQELSATRMGLLSGGLASCGWIVSSLWQIYVGKYIELHRSYHWAFLIAGLAPLVGCLALWLAWPRQPNRPAS